MKSKSFLKKTHLGILALCVATPVIAGIDSGEHDPQRPLNESRGWLRLLQYRDDELPSRSIALNAEFFANPQGMDNPVAEWDTLTEYFANPAILHPQRHEPWACVFPARFSFIRKALDKNWPRPACADFDAWKSRFPKDHAALVFSSAYKGNPASIFGHTFLVFNSNQDLADEGRGTLLGYAVAFLADTQGDSNPLTYTVSGLTGGFQGKFDIQTYYETVNNYNNSENRDLWEYPLKLTADERDLLIDLIWEVGQSGHFKYYFFDENCSWQMLSLLEAARPEFDLKSLSPFVTIPSETIRDVINADGVEGLPRWRPSLRKKTDAHIAKLSKAEQIQALALLDGERPEPSPRPEIWDAAVMSGNWRLQKSGRAIPESDKILFKKLLSDRAKQPSSSDNIKLSQDSDTARNRPDLGHSVHHAELGAIRESAATYESISPIIGFGLGFSDRLASDVGFEPDSGITYLTARLRHNNRTGSFIVRDAVVVKVETYSPWRSYDPSWSWSLGLSARENTIADATDLIAAGSGGVSLRTITGDLRLLAAGEIIATNHEKTENRRVNAGPVLMYANGNKAMSAEISVSHLTNVYAPSAWRSTSEVRATAAWHIDDQFEWRLAVAGERVTLKSQIRRDRQIWDSGIRAYF